MWKSTVLLMLVLGVAALVTVACGAPGTPSSEPAPVGAGAAATPAAEAAAAVEHQFDRAYPFHLTDVTVTAFQEAPMLAEQVAAGELPAVAERLPERPAVLAVLNDIGQYGGNARGHLFTPAHWFIRARELAHADLVRQVAGNTGEFEADMAERWEVSDDSKVWTFYLRKGLKWSDGEPFTTEDIVFWADDVLKNTDLMPTPPAMWTAAGGLPTVEAVDETTLRVTFAQPYPLFLLNLTYVHLGTTQMQNWGNHPKHYLQQFHASYADPAELEAKVQEAGLQSWVELYKREYEAHTATPGRPYMWAWTPDGPITADGRWSWTRNPYFWKVDEEGNQLPYIDTWSFELVEDPETILLKVIAGDFDFFGVYLRADAVPALKDAENKGAPIHVIDVLNGKTGEMSIFINETTADPVLAEIFQDLRFRQAVSLAIDREEVVEVRFRGFAEAGQAAYPSIDPYLYDPDWFQSYTEFDPERSNQLLDEMGLTERDSAGYRLLPDGRRFQVTMDIQEGEHNDGYELFPSYMQAIGIELKLRINAPAVFYERTSGDEAQWDGWAWWGSYFRTDGLIPRLPSSSWGSQWAVWYATRGAEGQEPPADLKRVMELRDQALTAQSTEERVELLREAGELHKKNLWVIGVAGMDVRPNIISSKLRNVTEDTIVSYGINQDSSTHSFYSEQWYFGD
jgi:peptide/nickel transport system substrate-binding protein